MDIDKTSEDYKLGRELAEKLGSAVNSYNTTQFAAGLIDGLGDQHRTLQQAVMGVFVRWCLHLASLESGWYDLRNEASVKLAKRIVSGEAARDIYQGRATDTFLPMI